MLNLPYAEDMNYWKTSSSSPDIWIDRTKKLINDFGGRVRAEAFGSTEGRSAFMLEFEISGDHFKLIWPVLPTRTKNEKATKIQAATMLHHDVKNRLLSAAILGARNAFLNYFVLPNGKAAGEASAPELAEVLPEISFNSKLLPLPKE